MGPKDIKLDIYNVMTNSRELTNYCQESGSSFQSKKISNSLNNFHLESAVDFVTRSLINQDRLFFESMNLPVEQLDSENARKRKAIRRQEKEEIENLKNEVSDIKKMLGTIIEKLDGSNNN